MNAMVLKSDGSIPDEAHAKAAHTDGKMKQKVYEKELHKLQVELCRLQDWVKEAGARIIILFEGRDAAGKGGTIKAITERVSPRRCRAAGSRLPWPTQKQKAAQEKAGVPSHVRVRSSPGLNELPLCSEISYNLCDFQVLAL